MPKFLVVFVVMCLRQQSQTINFYFGNLHAHSAFSDGNKDSTTTLVNSPAESFAYAKLTKDFDFLGISEHNHYSSAHNPGFRLPRYQEGLAMADSMNEEGKFLCLYGMEYGVSSSNNGHVIIYGFDKVIGWESNVANITGPNYDIYNPKSDYDALFKKVKNNNSSFCYLAHPFWTDFCTDGTDSSAIAFADYNSMYDSAIVGLPLRSGNAFSTFTNYADYATTDYFVYFKKMLHSGYHIGIGYDHDNHYTNFGRSNGGRLVLLMPSLSRSNLYKAMKQMNYYGSDDSNARLHFEVNGQIMGTSLLSNDYPVISVLHVDPDGESADTIRIWKGWKSSSAWAFTLQTVTSSNALAFTDTQVQKGTEYYYFCDVRQKDGQWMVSSPIWYTAGNTLSLKTESDEISRIFPQPARDFLNIVFADSKERKIELRDLRGTLLWSYASREQQVKIDLNNTESGVYILSVFCHEKTEHYKIFRN